MGISNKNKLSMKFFTSAILVGAVSASGAGIADTFTACAKRDPSNCPDESADCCAKFKKKGSAYRYDGVAGYYCLTYTERILWGAEFIDYADSEQPYRWIC